MGELGSYSLSVPPTPLVIKLLCADDFVTTFGTTPAVCSALLSNYTLFTEVLYK